MFSFNKLKELETRIQELEVSRITLTLKVKALSELVYNRLEEKYADKDREITPKKPTRKRDNR
jgi:hypothetical protein